MADNNANVDEGSIRSIRTDEILIAAYRKDNAPHIKQTELEPVFQKDYDKMVNIIHRGGDEPEATKLYDAIVSEMNNPGTMSAKDALELATTYTAAIQDEDYIRSLNVVASKTPDPRSTIGKDEREVIVNGFGRINSFLLKQGFWRFNEVAQKGEINTSELKTMFDSAVEINQYEKFNNSVDQKSIDNVKKWFGALTALFGKSSPQKPAKRFKLF